MKKNDSLLYPLILDYPNKSGNDVVVDKSGNDLLELDYDMLEPGDDIYNLVMSF